jgi:DNA polymerase-3 subunit delta
MILRNLEALEADLGARLRPVYLVLGPEEFLCREAVRLLKRKVLSPGSADFDLSDFEAGAVSADGILEAANTFPMVSGRRLVLVRDAARIRESDQEALIAGLETLSPKTVMVFLAGEMDHRRKFYRTLLERHCVCEFQKLKDAALEKWAAAWLRREGRTLAPGALKRLLQMAGSDLEALAAELEKLVLYAGGAGTIPAEAVEGLVRSSRQHDIFQLIDAVGAKDRSGALQKLAGLLGTGEHPLVVVTMLARHCRQILIARECLEKRVNAREIAAAAQVPPFVLEKLLGQAKRAETAVIEEMFLRLAAIDKQPKSSALDGRRLLEGLICGLV